MPSGKVKQQRNLTDGIGTYLHPIIKNVNNYEAGKNNQQPVIKNKQI